MSNDTVELDLTGFGNKTKPVHRKSRFYNVDEYTLDGQYLRTWESAGEAADFHHSSITTVCECCRGKMLLCERLGRIFLMKGEDIEKRLEEIGKQKAMPNRKESRVEVMEYDMEGRMTFRWLSLTSIQEHYGFSRDRVVAVCKGKKLFDKSGRIFLYEGDSIEDRLEAIRQERLNEALSKSVDEYTLDGKLVKHWRSASDISAEYGIPMSEISSVCVGNSRHCKGRIFLFSGDSIEQRLNGRNKKNND